MTRPILSCAYDGSVPCVAPGVVVPTAGDLWMLLGFVLLGSLAIAVYLAAHRRTDRTELPHGRPDGRIQPVAYDEPPPRLNRDDDA